MEPWRPVDAGNGGMEDQNGVSRPVVADSHHIDEKQNPDPDQSEIGIWIRIKVMRIRNTAYCVTKYRMCFSVSFSVV